MLPTLLYRLDKLLLAEDLLVKINSLCNIEVENNSNSKFKRFKVIFLLFFYHFFIVPRRHSKD